MDSDYSFQNSLIDRSIKNSWDHVFFISNQISLINSKLIIEKFKINTQNIKIFSFRDIDTSIINVTPLKVEPKRFDSYIDKIFWESMSGRRIINELKKNNNKFILYVEWAYREAEKVINFKNCIGHNYIEMGQHSYMNIPMFSPKKLSFMERFNKNWKNKLSDIDKYAHYYFRDDADSFIGISNDIFPCIPDNKKLILKNLVQLKEVYSPRLIGDKVIGLTCATRRLKRNEWKKMIDKLISELPDGAVVKPHPSFTVNSKIYSEFKDIFFRTTQNKYKLCDNNVILELEMLHEKKIIIGSQTSLSRYAIQLGSKFKNVNLY